MSETTAGAVFAGGTQDAEGAREVRGEQHDGHRRDSSGGSGSSGGSNAEHRRKPSSRAGLFLRSVIPDLVLCLVVATGLGYAVLSGFDATLSMRSDIGLQLALVGGMLVILFAGSWSKGARAASIAGAVALFVAALVVATSSTPEGVSLMEGGSLNDVEGNYAVFATVELVVAILTYVLSRRPASALFLVVASVFVCAVVQYLFRDWLSDEGGLVIFLAVTVASFALAVYQRYRRSAASSDRLVAPSFATAATTGLVIAALCIGGAGLVYVGIIAPLNLGTPIFKPFEYRIIHPIVEYTGAYDQLMVEDPDKFSSLLSEKADETTQNAEGGASPQENSEEPTSNPLATFVQSLTVFSEDSWTESFSTVTIDQLKLGALIAALVIAALCALAVAARIRWRKLRLRRIEREAPARQVVLLYDFILSRYARLGLRKPEQSTPLEYAYDFRRKMVPFTRNTGKVDLVRITLIYQRAAYGSGDLKPGDLDTVKRYYRAFFNNAHRYVGTVKWLWKFWRI